ncbi:MAG: hypothetical protein AAFO03_17005 [Bacteroidota bacterium]
MKFLHPSFLLVLLILLGCGQPNSQENSSADEEVAEATNNEAAEQEEPSDNAPLAAYKARDIKSIITLFREENIDETAYQIRVIASFFRQVITHS